jgi:hypothetical protein
MARTQMRTSPVEGMIICDEYSVITIPLSKSPFRHLEDRVLLTLLVDPSDEGKRLRQSTPFAGILSKAEREAITRKMPSIH